MRSTSALILLGMLVLLAAGGYLVFRNHDKSLVEAVSEEHQNIARGFANGLWKMHSFKLLPLMSPDNAQLAEEIDVAVFASDLASYLSGMNITSVQAFSPHKQPLAIVPEGANAPPVSMEWLDGAISTKKPQTARVDGTVMTVMPIVKDEQVQLVLAFDSLHDNSLFKLELAGLFLVVMALAGGIYMAGNIAIRNAEGLITKQYEENAALQSQAELAREENKQKSQFLANITHELRTPLNAIIGFSDILKNEFIPAPGQGSHTNYINDIHSAGTHLLSLINDILDYSKAEAGKLELEVTEVNVIKMIQNCIRLVSPRAEMGNVRLLEALPKTPVVMMTDGKKFKQVLLNLLSNAVKFTPPEGSVKVSIWEDLQEDVWVFEVRDSGIGIAPKDISRAMAPFGQVDNALSRKFEGTGLGLPLTKKFVELMGGTFTISSEPDKGTTVTFALPKEFKAPEGVIVKQVA